MTRTVTMKMDATAIATAGPVGVAVVGTSDSLVGKPGNERNGDS